MLTAAWRLVRSAVSAWVDDYAASMGAALAFYTLFSIAPLLLIAISVAGLAFGQDAARGEIFGQLSGMLGDDSAKAVESMLEGLNRPEAGIISTVIGIALLLVGATTVFAELQDAMDRIWRAPTRPKGGLWALIRARLLSLGMVMGIGFLLMVSLVMSAGLSALGKWFGPWFGEQALIAQALNLVISFALVTAMFAMIYKVIPRVKIAWRDVWVGASLTALLFTVGKYLIGLYIGSSGVASPFGAAGSLVVLLLWVYYSAQIFLLGAEFTWVYSHEHGSRKGKDVTPPSAAPVPQRGQPGPDGLASSANAAAPSHLPPPQPRPGPASQGFPPRKNLPAS